MLKWHKEKCEEVRKKFGLTHYQLYWISFIKGVALAILIVWISK